MTHTVSSHAISRYIARVANVTADEAEEALRSPAIEAGINLGATYVRLPGGQRVVIQDGAVITVLPADHYRKQIARRNIAPQVRTRYGR